MNNKKLIEITNEEFNLLPDDRKKSYTESNAHVKQLIFTAVDIARS